MRTYRNNAGAGAPVIVWAFSTTGAPINSNATHMKSELYIPVQAVRQDGDRFKAEYRGAVGFGATKHQAVVQCACAIFTCCENDVEISTRAQRYAAYLSKPSIVFALAEWAKWIMCIAVGALLGAWIF